MVQGKALNTRKFSDIPHYSVEAVHDFGGAETHNQAQSLLLEIKFSLFVESDCRPKIGENHNMKLVRKSDGNGNHSSKSNTRVAGVILEVSYTSILTLTKSIRPWI